MRTVTFFIGWIVLCMLATQSVMAQATDRVGQTYRRIDAAHFEMGSNESSEFRHDHPGINELDNRTIHSVIITTPFDMAATEVTVSHFRKFADETGYETTAEKADGIVGWKPEREKEGRLESAFAQAESFSWRNPGFSQSDSHPVVGVSYHDAKAYCDWLSSQDGGVYRLPTEAEWELACRAGTQTHFSFGNAYRDLIQNHANIGNVELEIANPESVSLQWLVDVDSDSGDGFVFTAPVGSFHANDWGLHDMHGNVWEWCEDLYLDTFYDQFKREKHRAIRSRAIDPICTQRWNEHGQWQVIRGGSWYLSPHGCRTATRGVFSANDAACYVGFRVVREVDADVAAAAKSRHEESEAALTRLLPLAREQGEYEDGEIHLEFNCDQINDAIINDLHRLQYRIDLMIRPPGTFDSQLAGKLFPESGGIKHLVGFGLATGCESVNDQTFVFLRACHELERLQITGTGELADSHVCDHLIGATELREISLQGSGITDAGIARLPALRGLERLEVHSTACTGAALSRFVGSPLQNVSIGHLTDEGAAMLGKFPELRFANFHGSPIGGAGLESLATLPILETLNLSDCGNLNADDFACLSSIRRLRSLYVGRTSAGDVAMEALVNLHGLHELGIGSENLSDAGCLKLAEIVSLKQLDIGKEATKVTDVGLQDYWRLQNLQHVTIDAPSVTVEGLFALAECPSLKKLTLSKQQHPDFSESDIQALQQKMGDQVEVSFR